MQIAILCGGLATRLGCVAREQPKSMLIVHRKPFLEHQLGFLRREGVRDIVLCVGHLGEQIEGYFGDGTGFGVNIVYSREPKLLGTAGALKNAQDLLDDPFFTLYGDSYIFLDFADAMRYFKSQSKLALMTVYKNYDCYDRSNTVVEGNLVREFSKKERAEGMVYIEYGACIFRKEVFNLIPGDQFYPLEELFPCLIERRELFAYEVKERFYEIGSSEGLREFEEYMDTRGQDDSQQSADQNNPRRWRD